MASKVEIESLRAELRAETAIARSLDQCGFDRGGALLSGAGTGTGGPETALVVQLRAQLVAAEDERRVDRLELRKLKALESGELPGLLGAEEAAARGMNRRFRDGEAQERFGKNMVGEEQRKLSELQALHRAEMAALRGLRRAESAKESQVVQEAAELRIAIPEQERRLNDLRKASAEAEARAANVLMGGTRVAQVVTLEMQRDSIELRAERAETELQKYSLLVGGKDNVARESIRKAMMAKERHFVLLLEAKDEQIANLERSLRSQSAIFGRLEAKSLMESQRSETVKHEFQQLAEAQVEQRVTSEPLKQRLRAVEQRYQLEVSACEVYRESIHDMESEARRYRRDAKKHGQTASAATEDLLASQLSQKELTIELGQRRFWGDELYTETQYLTLELKSIRSVKTKLLGECSNTAELLVGKEHMSEIYAAEASNYRNFWNKERDEEIRASICLRALRRQEVAFHEELELSRRSTATLRMWAEEETRLVGVLCGELRNEEAEVDAVKRAHSDQLQANRRITRNDEQVNLLKLSLAQEEAANTSQLRIRHSMRLGEAAELSALRSALTFEHAQVGRLQSDLRLYQEAARRAEESTELAALSSVMHQEEIHTIHLQHLEAQQRYAGFLPTSSEGNGHWQVAHRAEEAQVHALRRELGLPIALRQRPQQLDEHFTGLRQALSREEDEIDRLQTSKRIAMLEARAEAEEVERLRAKQKRPNAEVGPARAEVWEDSKQEAHLASRIPDVARLETLLQSSDNRVKVLRSELHGMIKHHESIQHAEAATRDKEKSSLQVDVEALRETVLASRIENSDLSLRISSLQSEVDAARAQIQMERESAEFYRKAETSAELGLREVAGANYEDQAQLARLRNELNVLKAEEQKQRNMGSELRAAEAKLFQAKQDYILMEQRVKAVKLEDNSERNLFRSEMLQQQSDADIRLRGVVAESATKVQTLESSLSRLSFEFKAELAQVDRLKSSMHAQMNSIFLAESDAANARAAEGRILQEALSEVRQETTRSSLDKRYVTDEMARQAQNFKSQLDAKDLEIKDLQRRLYNQPSNSVGWDNAHLSDIMQNARGALASDPGNLNWTAVAPLVSPVHTLPGPVSGVFSAQPSSRAATLRARAEELKDEMRRWQDQRPRDLS